MMTTTGMESIDWNAEYADRAPGMVAELERLVTTESPSRDVEGIRDVATIVERALGETGASVSLVEGHANGPNLVARFGEGNRPILLLGHLDTVWKRGTLETMPWRVDGDRAFGPGVFDMKAGVLVVIEALRGLSRHGCTTPLTIVLNCDEEIGSSSSRALIADHARLARAALVFEPAIPGGLAKTSRSGMAGYRIVVRGRAAHAGVDPEKGVSAILAAARVVIDLHAINDLANGLSVNAGVFEGGTRPNVIAASATIGVDVRFRTQAQADRVHASIMGLESPMPDASIQVTGGIDRPPFESTRAGLALYDRAVGAARLSGFDLGHGHVGGVSDGNFTAALGVPTLDGLGPDGMGAHADHEQVVLSDLPRRAAMLTRLLLDLGREA
ncbi:MAG: M20 family metallopeptidase [Blastocatellia bacterium]|nr:M20 family metallopeptidase [Blastocatellia bacterium]